MAAHQAPLSLGFSGQEHWSALPFPSPVHESKKRKWNRSVLSDSSRPYGLQPTRLLRPWDFPGKSTGVGCHCLLVFLILLFSSVSLHCSFKKAFLSLLAILCNSTFSWVYLSLSPFPFSAIIFVKPPQTTLCLLAFLFLWDCFGHCLLYSVPNFHPWFFRHSVYQI